ncbi:MAG TPA: glycosyltransferase [Ignavibacteriaceae bacterium]|nr:glycosyltransferase [Ignavibacteriaceae bacterium]
MKKPLVSVIISTYNSENFIVGRLEDLIEQTIFEDIELIIVNSGSLQDEENKIKLFLEKYGNIKYYRTSERETIYRAWNRAIKIASGKYITNGNTDDRLVSNALEMLSTYLTNNEDVALVYGNQYIVKSVDKASIKENIIDKYITPDYSSFQLCYQYFAGSQSMWRSSLHFQENIWFDDSYEVAGDYEFITRVALKHKISHINEFVGYYYKSTNNTNKEFQNTSQTINETIKIQEVYTPLYIKSLSKEDRKTLVLRLLLLLEIPRKLYGLIKKICDCHYKRKIVPTRIYLTFIISVLLENEGNYQKALRLCKKYENNDSAIILHRRIKNLIKNNHER